MFENAEEEINKQKVHSVINFYSHALRSLARSFQYSKQVYFCFLSTTLTLHHFHNFPQCEEFGQV